MTSDQETSPIVIRRIASSGKHGDWKEFNSRYGLLIRNYCRRICFSPKERDELVQEVFLALLQSLPRFQYEKAKGGFRAYLWRVVRNQALTLHRRRQARPLPLQAEFLESSQDPDRIWDEEWVRYHVRGALEQLGKETSSAHMRVFRLYALEKRPVDEVASRCGCSKAMVYKIKSLLLPRLRKIIERKIALENGSARKP